MPKSHVGSFIRLIDCHVMKSGLSDFQDKSVLKNLNLQEIT